MSPTEVIPNFQAATQPLQRTSHTYTTVFDTNWCIGSVPHGGYVAAALIRAASLHFASTLAHLNQPNLLTLHFEYLRRTSTGPAQISIRDTKLGRGTSTVHVSLTQPEVDPKRGEEVVGYLTYTNLSTQQGAHFATNWRMLPPAPNLSSVEVLRSDRGDENWARTYELPFSDFRKASKRVRWFFPRASTTANAAEGANEANRAICNATAAATTDDVNPAPNLQGYNDQWISLSTRSHPDEPYERWTDDALGFICDMFPQIVETFLIPGVYTPDSAQNLAAQKASPAAKFWYPTLLMNIEVKKSLGPQGREWLFLRVQAKEIKNGRYDLEVTVCDEEGDLVAVSHHVCFALPASRNLSKRGGEAKGKL